MSATAPDAEGMPIAAVEQATGIARATLRIWERRYDFPRPGRDLRGERSYPPDQVQRLRTMAALVARGHRPGRLIQLTPAQLAALAGPAGAAEGVAAGRRPARADGPLVKLLQAHDLQGLVRHLEDAVRRDGLAAFVSEQMPAWTQQVGDCWARGDLQVYEEHLYTEAVQQVLRAALAAQPARPDRARPRVLLATFPEEGHGLGLLMAQVMFTLQGCACTSLGLRVPVPQLVAAAAAFRPDIVGLSFTASVNPANVLRGLEQLRGELPPQVQVWVGGSCPVLGRRKLPGVQAIAHVRDVVPALGAWRQQQGGPAALPR